MALDPTLLYTDWSRFPGLYELVLAVLPRPVEFLVIPDDERESGKPPYWHALPGERRMATVTVTVRVPLPKGP